MLRVSVSRAVQRMIGIKIKYYKIVMSSVIVSQIVKYTLESQTMFLEVNVKRYLLERSHHATLDH